MTGSQGLPAVQTSVVVPKTSGLGVGFGLGFTVGVGLGSTTSLTTSVVAPRTWPSPPEGRATKTGPAITVEVTEARSPGLQSFTPNTSKVY